MSLLLNVSRIGSMPITTLYGGNIAGEWNNFIKDPDYIARFTTFNQNNGAVLGVNQKSWIKPLKANAMSMRSETISSATFTAQNARNSTMNATTTSDGTMNMSVVINSSMSATTVTNGTLNAQSILKATINGASISDGALAMSVIMKSSMSGLSTSDGVMNMKGIMRASMTSIDDTGLTPASIWSYGDRTLTSIDIEVSGLTVEEHNKLMSTSSKADVYNASMI